MKKRKSKNLMYPELDTVATGHRIGHLMQEKHLCIKDVSRVMNVSYQAVYRWLRGETLPTIGNFYTLSQLMRTDVDDMLVAKERTDGDLRSV